MDIEQFINEQLPCMQTYFKGNYNYKDKKCFQKHKCEYLNGMMGFIDNEYPDYKIIHCCDIESHDGPQPEAILSNSDGECIALEMKCIPTQLSDTVKKTELSHNRENYFWKKIIDDCGKKAYEKLYYRIHKLYKGAGKEIEDELVHTLIQIIFMGLTVKLYSKTEEKSIQQIFMDKKKEYLNKEILSDEMCNFSYKIFIDLLNDKEPTMFYKVDKDQYSILLFLTRSNEVKFEVHDNKTFTLGKAVRINESGLKDFLDKFLAESERKFNNLSYPNISKNILLLDQNFVCEGVDVIDKCLKKCKKPKCALEIWVCDKVIESDYNDDGEEIGEHIADIKYIKLYDSKQLDGQDL